MTRSPNRVSKVEKLLKKNQFRKEQEKKRGIGTTKMFFKVFFLKAREVHCILIYNQY